MHQTTQRILSNACRLVSTTVVLGTRTSPVVRSRSHRAADSCLSRSFEGTPKDVYRKKTPFGYPILSCVNLGTKCCIGKEGRNSWTNAVAHHRDVKFLGADKLATKPSQSTQTTGSATRNHLPRLLRNYNPTVLCASGPGPFTSLYVSVEEAKLYSGKRKRSHHTTSKGRTQTQTENSNPHTTCGHQTRQSDDLVEAREHDRKQGSSKVD